MRETNRLSVSHKDRVPSFTYALVCIAALLLTYRFIGYPIYITDRSLHAYKIAICFRFIEPKEGDLVSFTAPINVYQLAGIDKGRRFVKKLLVRDPFVEYKGNTVVVNGTVLRRDIEGWKEKFKLSLDNFEGIMKGYFVIGDVINSIDSRYFGTIKEADKCIGII